MSRDDNLENELDDNLDVELGNVLEQLESLQADQHLWQGDNLIILEI